MVQHTTADVLGQPVAEGDVIAYAAPAGTGSASLNFAIVEKLVAIVPHPNGEPHHFVREDQLKRSKPTRFYRQGYAVQVRDHYPRRDVNGWINGWSPAKTRKTLTDGQMHELIKVAQLKIEVPA